MYNDEPLGRGGGEQHVGGGGGWGGLALGCISFLSPIFRFPLLSPIFSFALYVSVWGAGDKAAPLGPAMPAGDVDGTRSICKKPPAVASAAEPLPWPFGPHVAGY